MTDDARFVIRRLDAPPKSLKQGCSCGGAVLAKREFVDLPATSEPEAAVSGEPTTDDA